MASWLSEKLNLKTRNPETEFGIRKVIGEAAFWFHGFQIHPSVVQGNSNSEARNPRKEGLIRK
jgi:hypothetical protein